ncbi:50S ribosomal protein L18 [Psychromonas sp. MB-3u-54]|jgi:large subunit ribosomal protein L18|uniref:Large ribosomal subunit protein uL18 n=1 Tax=Psychromonas ingrahamii (strain DSM 17664 / CCUG 51855 / 37) TaxID=357804 RepID=RL18_PSYIN|nr:MULTISPECIES: 50S ribosomal protein L18 [Psychromonas]A1T0C6.1 RecName: Full=Large ribosomal subunit protein uL18; AltName: Full=50S ribosomal protein L18 [Psychromonas ingrahamii 37]ABM05191.1 LSU ribosomal protein L18P [Psychromonas ingrahamii 37]PKH02580.1 50S ribosomal protein L18 [Psychromonas sp. MB-3u-54]
MDKKASRLRRATRTRKKLQELGATRLVINRTPRHTYAQVITADAQVVASASTLEKEVRAQISNGGNKEAAQLIGKLVAERAVEKGISKISFDRSGFQYHGRVAALAEAAREAGLQF